MAEEGEERLYLTWTDHPQVLQRVMSALRYKEKFADVTLVCGKKQYAAHKFVLSMCSSYFEELFEFSPCQHPIIVLVGTFSDALEKLLDFMYLGQADIHPDNLDALLDIAHELKIKGLTKDYPEGSVEAESEVSKPFIKQEPTEEIIQIKQEPIEDFISIKHDPSEEIPVIQIKQEPTDGIVQERTWNSIDVKKEEVEQYKGINSRDPSFGCFSSKVSSFGNKNTGNNKGKRKNTRKKPDNSSYNKKRKVCEEASPSPTIQMTQMTFTCSKCGESFGHLKDLDNHAFWHVYRFLTCPDCPYKTISYKDLKVHINRHILVRPYTCTYCKDRQFNRELHVTHQQKKHPKEDIIIKKRTLEGELEELKFNIEKETLRNNEAPKICVVTEAEGNVMSVIDGTGKKVEETKINVASKTTRKATTKSKPKPCHAKPWRISNFCE